jgi:uncharacterized protein (DUF427 family)
VWDYPRPPRLEPSPERIRIFLGGELIAETVNSFRVLETSHPPVYYLPRAAFRAGSLEPAEGTSLCEYKGQAEYLTVRGGGLTADRAAWSYPRPTDGYAQLAGYVAVYPGRMDRCEVDGEQVTAQAGDFYGGWITGRVLGPYKGGAGTTGW